jgi:hypothetical protein
MLRNFCLLASTILLVMSCQSGDSQTQEVAYTELSIAEFNASPDDYVDKALQVSGAVDHVCHHGGKKMFIMGDDPEQRMKIDAGEAVGSFPQELVGSDVEAQGVVRVLKVDEAYLDEWEAEVLRDAENVEEESKDEESDKICAADHQGASTADSSGLADSSEATPASSAEDSVTTAAEVDGHHSENPALERINSLRQKLAESDKDYLGFYSLECVSYEELTE